MLANPRANVYISVESAHRPSQLPKPPVGFHKHLFSFTLEFRRSRTQTLSFLAVTCQFMDEFISQPLAPLKRSGIVNAGLEAHQEPQADNNRTL